MLELVRNLKERLSHVIRKPDFCLCENKGTYQLHSNCEADQRLCFRYTYRTIPLLFKSEISSFYPSSVAAQASLCRTWSETPKTGFLVSRLKFSHTTFFCRKFSIIHTSDCPSVDNGVLCRDTTPEACAAAWALLFASNFFSRAF